MRTRNIKRLMIGEILSSLFVISALSGQSARKQPCRPPSPQILQRSQQYLENIPSVPIATACNKGGYILGCSSVKMGLVWECMAPLLYGKTVPGAEMPPTDPDVRLQAGSVTTSGSSRSSARQPTFSANSRPTGRHPFRAAK